MNIAAYLSLVDTVSAELAKVRTKLEQAQDQIGDPVCNPTRASPVSLVCDGIDIHFTPDELQVEFNAWLAAISDKLNHPPGDDA